MRQKSSQSVTKHRKNPLEDTKKQGNKPLLGKLIVSLEQSQRMRSRRDCETKDEEDV